MASGQWILQEAMQLWATTSYYISCRPTELRRSVDKPRGYQAYYRGNDGTTRTMSATLVPVFTLIFPDEATLGLSGSFADPGMLTAPALNLTGCNTALSRATSLRQARSWEGQLLTLQAKTDACGTQSAHGTKVSITFMAPFFLGAIQSQKQSCQRGASAFAASVTDTLIFGLTAYRAYADHNVMKLVESSSMKRMMKDVAFEARCILVIVLANLGNVFTLYFSDVVSSSYHTRLGLNLQRAGAPPPARTEDLDSTKLDVIRFKDPRPPQLLEEATVDDQDFELTAERENARVEVRLSEQRELNRGQD
ncbi:hypothetical protein DFH09DRAFT_1077054 [Mycena vulgaris]|nr:hypothetical protein DFH09DRAFT_1077054 [Mycena vulgaris]